MNEPFDVEISRALKESATRELEGWEFTPAMQSSVLQRIRAGEADAPAPAGPARRRFDPVPLLRPLAWVAVAAAAVMLVVNVGMPGMGSKKAQEASPKMAPVAATAPAQNADAADSAAMKAAGSPAEGARSSAAQESPATAQPPMAYNRLTVPAMSAEALPAPTTTLAAPGRDPKTMGGAGATTNFSADGASANAVVLNQSGVQAVDATGTPVWTASLREVSAETVLAVADDGRVAVGGPGNRVEILNAAGQPDRVLFATAGVEQLVWSNDGRVASAEGSLVTVYNAADGQQEYHVDAAGERAMAFADDGRLAVLARQPNGTLILTMNQQRATAWKNTVADAGNGLAFTAGGDIVVAAGQAFSRSGQATWQVPLHYAEGLEALGDDRVLAWTGGSVVALDGRSGYLLWQADLDVAGTVHRVVPSPDGRYVAIVAQTDSGAVLWVVNDAGATVHSEVLGEMPVDLTFTGNRLLLVLPHSMTVRELGS